MNSQSMLSSTKWMAFREPNKPLYCRRAVICESIADVFTSGRTEVTLSTVLILERSDLVDMC